MILHVESHDSELYLVISKRAVGYRVYAIIPKITYKIWYRFTFSKIVYKAETLIELFERTGKV